MRFLPAYLFVSHGLRHASSLKDLPGAQSQLRTLENHAGKGEAQLRVMGYDYGRKIRSSDDLSVLFCLLQGFQRDGMRNGLPARLIIDDYARLFRNTDAEFRPELWDMLLEYSDHILDLRQGRPLHSVSPEMSSLVRSGLLPPIKTRTPIKDRSDQEKGAQTAKARLASTIARSKYAKLAQTALYHAYAKHQSETPRASFREFIDSPAAEGLKNSQGRPWTYRTGLRAIREMKSDLKETPTGGSEAGQL